MKLLNSLALAMLMTTVVFAGDSDRDKFFDALQGFGKLSDSVRVSASTEVTPRGAASVVTIPGSKLGTWLTAPDSVVRAWSEKPVAVRYIYAVDAVDAADAADAESERLLVDALLVLKEFASNDAIQEIEDDLSDCDPKNAITKLTRAKQAYSKRISTDISVIDDVARFLGTVIDEENIGSLLAAFRVRNLSDSCADDLEDEILAPGVKVVFDKIYELTDAKDAVIDALSAAVDEDKTTFDSSKAKSSLAKLVEKLTQEKTEAEAKFTAAIIVIQEAYPAESGGGEAAPDRGDESDAEA